MLTLQWPERIGSASQRISVVNMFVDILFLYRLYDELYLSGSSDKKTEIMAIFPKIRKAILANLDIIIEVVQLNAQQTVGLNEIHCTAHLMHFLGRLYLFNGYVDFLDSIISNYCAGELQFDMWYFLIASGVVPTKLANWDFSIVKTKYFVSKKGTDLIAKSPIRCFVCLNRELGWIAWKDHWYKHHNLAYDVNNRDNKLEIRCSNQDKVPENRRLQQNIPWPEEIGPIDIKDKVVEKSQEPMEIDDNDEKAPQPKSNSVELSCLRAAMSGLKSKQSETLKNDFDDLHHAICYIQQRLSSIENGYYSMRESGPFLTKCDHLTDNVSLFVSKWRQVDSANIDIIGSEMGHTIKGMGERMKKLRRVSFTKKNDKFPPYEGKKTRLILSDNEEWAVGDQQHTKWLQTISKMRCGILNERNNWDSLINSGAAADFPCLLSRYPHHHRKISQFIGRISNSYNPNVHILDSDDDPNLYDMYMTGFCSLNLDEDEAVMMLPAHESARLKEIGDFIIQRSGVLSARVRAMGIPMIPGQKGRDNIAIEWRPHILLINLLPLVHLDFGLQVIRHRLEETTLFKDAQRCFIDRLDHLDDYHAPLHQVTTQFALIRVPPRYEEDGIVSQTLLQAYNKSM